MPAYSTHRAPVESRRKRQCGGKMVLRSDIKTASNGVKKRSTRLSKLKSHLPFLCSCFKSSGKQRRDMITTANRGQIESISEIALNLLKGNILVPKSSFERLKPHKDKLLYLTRKKPSLKQKKQVLNQKGGFLPALAGLIAPLAVDLLGKLFK